MLKWSISLILFCTPIPLLLLLVLTIANSYGAESDYIQKNGYTLRHEEWVYRSNGKMAINKYYRMKTPDETDESNDKRDSTWVYFNKDADTVKIEQYNNGKLISTRLKINN